MRQAGQPLSPAKALPTTQLIHGDCLEVMPTLPASSVQMVFADLPYSIRGRRQTSNSWDQQIPLDKCMQAIKRLIVHHSALCFTATQPFSSLLVTSWAQQFRYEIIYEKALATLFQHAKRQPLRAHESVLIFYDRQPTYNPQMTAALKPWSGGNKPLHMCYK